jgi:hypothetical protein
MRVLLCFIGYGNAGTMPPGYQKSGARHRKIRRENSTFSEKGTIFQSNTVYVFFGEKSIFSKETRGRNRDFFEASVAISGKRLCGNCDGDPACGGNGYIG